MKPWEHGALRVSGRYLLNGDVPFYWLGDTAWNLFQRLDLEQSHVYLKNRADKGFNVIQAILMGGFNEATSERPGDAATSGLDTFISIDNDVYWKHVESVVKMARDMGMYMGLLPTWGKFAKAGYLNAENAGRYISFVTGRFNKYENIIWLNGGDVRGDDCPEVWDICGNILRECSPGKLIGYHPFGRTSSTYWFNDCEWLEFNMFQSGHRRYDQQNLGAWDERTKDEPWYGEDNYRYVEADLAKKPLRPVLDGEPSYEQIPQGLHDFSQPYWEEHHIRRYAWWSVLAGACGHTYGNNAVFQFYGEGGPPSYGVKDTWDVSIHHAGSGQMGILKSLMLDIGFTDCAPMQELLGDDAGEKHDAIRVFGNGKSIAAYNYSGRNFTLKADVKADAWWFDPASGVRNYFGKVNLSDGKHFRPPAKKAGHNDWVLLLKI
jgi:hypothetical protein